jgi:hypothetical protein
MLIDGDNAQPSLIESVLTEAGKYGLVTIRRIYGDWTLATMQQWRDKLNVHAVQPIQQFRYTTGKNSTDSAMIIDAMDTLYEGVVDGFCLVSSDSDYTRLATRIREKGFFVMGVGRKETPRAFVNACEVFAYTENLRAEPTVPRPSRAKKAAPADDSTAPDPMPLLRSALDMAVQEDGWAFLGTVGSRLRQLDPGFDPRTYGHKQLSLLIRDLKAFEMNVVKSDQGPTSVFVRLKE